MNTKVFKVSCGKTHFMAIESFYLLYGAGEGSYACLGTGDSKFRKDLTLVKPLKKIRV